MSLIFLLHRHSTKSCNSNAIANHISADLRVRQKMKNKIHCNKYNTGVGTKSSSKTALSAEHERVLFVVQTKVSWRTPFIRWQSRQHLGIKVQSCPTHK